MASNDSPPKAMPYISFQHHLGYEIGYVLFVWEQTLLFLTRKRGLLEILGFRDVMGLRRLSTTEVFEEYGRARGRDESL
jgi:hypothetical protein